MDQIDINVRDAESEDLRAELEVAKADAKEAWEKLEEQCIAHTETIQKLAAEQAKNVELRRAFIGLMQVVPREVDCGNMHHKRKDQHEYDETCPVVSRYAEAIEQADKVLAAPSDTSALEAIVKKAGEVMRERSINVAWNNEPDCNGPIEMEIRALPAVTLEDLK